MIRKCSLYVAAPPALVWKSITDDGERSQWDSEIVSRQDDEGSALIVQAGRLRPARITVVRSTPGVEYVERIEAPLSDQTMTFSLRPEGDGTRLDAVSDTRNKTIWAIPIRIASVFDRGLLKSFCGMLAMHAESLVDGSATDREWSKADGQNRSERHQMRQLGLQDRAVAESWRLASSKIRSAVRYAFRSGTAYPSIRGARLTLAFGEAFSKTSSLVVSALLLTLVIPMGMFILVIEIREGFGIWGVFWLLFSVYLVSQIALMLRFGRRTMNSGVRMNAEWLEHHVAVHDCIRRLGEGDESARVGAVLELGQIPCGGPLNLQAENALRWAANWQPSLSAAATEALDSRRARALASAN